jgi:SAM-dependent methyltransferase
MWPASLLARLEGKDVLCLAAGGGQQSAVMGLLGAHVTVVDFSERQIQSDLRAARHYGYEINGIVGDMRDLSMLPRDGFDLVWQGPSMAYVPNVREVYRSVARVTKSGGTYRADAHDAGVAFAREQWENGGYKIDTPFSRRILYRPDGGVEFRHYFSDAFNGLLEHGFSIRGVFEDPNHFEEFPDAEPGEWQHVMRYLPHLLAIVASRVDSRASFECKGEIP